MCILGANAPRVESCTARPVRARSRERPRWLQSPADAGAGYRRRSIVDGNVAVGPETVEQCGAEPAVTRHAAPALALAMARRRGRRVFRGVYRRAKAGTARGWTVRCACGIVVGWCSGGSAGGRRFLGRCCGAAVPRATSKGAEIRRTARPVTFC